MVKEKTDVDRLAEAQELAEADAKLEAKRARMAHARASRAAQGPKVTKATHTWAADDETCPICTHEDRENLEVIYMGFLLKNRQLAILADTGVEAFERHVTAFSLPQKRADKPNNVRSYIVNKAFEEGLLDAPKLQDVIGLLGQIDRANGVGLAPQADQRPIIIIGVPEPGGRFAPPSVTIHGKVVGPPVVPMTVPKEAKEKK
jgi:hypothetical protein